MDETDWLKMQGAAQLGLRTALEEGRGADAMEMLNALQRIEDKVRAFREVRLRMEVAQMG